MGTMVMIKNVRCSFPQLWEEEVKNGQKYSRSITLVLHPESDQDALKVAKDAINAELKANPKIAETLKTKPHLIALRPSDHESHGEGAKIIKANTPRVPLVLNADKSKVTPENDPIYSGCRVNAKIEFWCQDNTHGKRLNAKVVAVQFAGDDESWDGSYIPEDKAVEGFDSVEGAAGADDGFDF